MRMSFLLLAANLYGQTAITFDPPVVTHCTAAGLGSGTLSWNYDGPGPVQVRIGAVDGTPLTDLVDPQGKIPVLDQVTDGMIFLLTDAASRELARTTASVRCNPAGEVLAPALSSASYFPLQVGNEWTYRFSTRFSNSEYLTRRIVRAELIVDTAWFVAQDSFSGRGPVPDSEVRYRNDDAGRIYQLTSQGERLWLDPNNPPDPSAYLNIVNRGGATEVPAGRFQDSLGFSVINGGLDLETGTFARGIGLLIDTHTSLEGSNYGIVEQLTMVSARIDGHIVFAPPGNFLELTTLGNDFDVTNKIAPNCAVSCAGVYCGMLPGPDPPGTYRPCFQARVRTDDQSCDLDLLDSDNNSLYHVTLPGTTQVPLYSAPNQPFPPGNYQLRAQTPDGRLSITRIQLR